MKRAKRIAALLLAGFFVFAPPGTIIFGLIVAAGLVRHFIYPGATPPVEPIVQTPAPQIPTPPPAPSPTPTPASQNTPTQTLRHSHR